MHKKLFILVLFFSFYGEVSAQDKSKFIDLSKTTRFIDTLLIDRNLDNWSIRAFTSFKQQRFIIKPINNKFTYSPNNPYGIGFGVGTKKAIFDFSFNLKASEENPTKRYDILWSFFKKNYLFDCYFQHYRGFDVFNQNTGDIIFREDIRSLSAAIRYVYMFREVNYSIASMKTGLVTAEKSTFSFGIGGFLMHSNQYASESIIPMDLLNLANNSQFIEKFQGTGMGIMLGFYFLIVLPNNFFVSFHMSPGVGMMSKYVTTEETGYQPKNFIMKQLGLSMLLGYNAKQYYVNLSVSNGTYSTDYDFGDEVVFGYINAKLVFGYKLKDKIKRNWKK